MNKKQITKLMQDGTQITLLRYSEGRCQYGHIVEDLGGGRWRIKVDGNDTTPDRTEFGFTQRTSAEITQTLADFRSEWATKQEREEARRQVALGLIKRANSLGFGCISIIADSSKPTVRITYDDFMSIMDTLEALRAAAPHAYKMLMPPLDDELIQERPVTNWDRLL